MPKKVRLGSLRLDLEQERQVILDNKVPTQPVEQGQNVSDSIDKQPDIVEESVIITPDDQTDSPEEEIRSKLQELLRYRDEEIIFRYVAPERVILEAAVASIEYIRESRVSYSVDLTIRQIQGKGAVVTEGEGAQTDAGRRSNPDPPSREDLISKEQQLELGGGIEDRLLGPDFVPGGG